MSYYSQPSPLPPQQWTERPQYSSPFPYGQPSQYEQPSLNGPPPPNHYPIFGQVYGIPPPPKPRPKVPTYSFNLTDPRVQNCWTVTDPNGGIVFTTKHKEGRWFDHPGGDVFQGIDGPLVASVYNEELTAGSFVTEIARHHDDKVTFKDPKGQEFAWRESENLGQLLLYPSKDVVAEGDVDLVFQRGDLKVLDYTRAPDAVLLVAAYGEFLRKRSSRQEDLNSISDGIKSGIGG